jgi:hypothetical protein
MDELEVWNEYGLRGNKIAESLDDTNIFVATADAYLAICP